MACRSFAVYIDEEKKLLSELLKVGSAMKRLEQGDRGEEEEEFPEPDLEDFMSDDWPSERYRQDLAEMYEDADREKFDRPSRVLLEILCWCWLTDIEAVNPLPEEESHWCEVDFFLTEADVSRLCRDFANIDPTHLASLLLEADCPNCFETVELLAEFLTFWRELFLKALRENKALCYCVGG